MLDHRERADGPAEPGTQPADRVLLGRDDLKQRLGRLADRHPSSPEYPAADRAPAERTPAERTPAERTPADSHPSSAEYRATDRDRPATLTDRSAGDSRRGPPDWHEGQENHDEPERQRTGWDAPDVRNHPERPDVTEIRLPDERGRHILDGGVIGGGHRHGTGRSGKSEFPSTWPDEVILPVVEEVSRTPDSVERQRNGRWLATGERDGVTVKTIVLSDGRIWTAWPEPGGPGVRQNPKDGDA